MPDSSGQPLPPLQKEALDGHKEEAVIIASLCNHSNVVLNAKYRELRCQCGAQWSGFGIDKLYEAFKRQK